MISQFNISLLIIWGCASIIALRSKEDGVAPTCVIVAGIITVLMGLGHFLQL